MADSNPFSWVLEKPRKNLDREFYNHAKSFEDVDDDMWRYLLNLVPQRGRSFAKRIKPMVQGLSPELRRYFLVRRFHNEWGSGGMESIFLEDEDWREWVPMAIVAYEELGAQQSAELIRRIAGCVPSRHAVMTDAELDKLSDELKAYDPRWQTLAESESVLESIWRDIQHDCTPYVHPPKP
jgi:hypothetical protein